MFFRKKYFFTIFLHHNTFLCYMNYKQYFVFICKQRLVQLLFPKSDFGMFQERERKSYIHLLSQSSTVVVQSLKYRDLGRAAYTLNV